MSVATVSLVGSARDGKGVPRASRGPTKIQELYEDLQALFESEKDKGVKIDNEQDEESFARLDKCVRTLIRDYIASNDDSWRGHCHWSDVHYTRNLINGSEDFELMVLCWGEGQVSRIHDHHKAHGWVTVLDGAVEEKRFKPSYKLERKKSTPVEPPSLPGVMESLAPCPSLDEIGSGVAKRGDGTLYINDHIALHSVGCAPGEAKAVTLHLYAPPVRRVQLFEPDENRVVVRVPGFFSVRGEAV